MAENTGLKNLRLKAGLSQSEASRRSGLNQSNISALEAGRGTPSGATLATLLDTYGQTKLAAELRRYLPTPTAS